jgi:hypothetical protein
MESAGKDLGTSMAWVDQVHLLTETAFDWEVSNLD